MDDTTPAPDTNLKTPPSVGPQVEFFIRASHQLRRVHDDSVISNYCSGPCGVDAMERLTLAELIGPHSPGPLQQVDVELVDLATGKTVGQTRGLTPSNGEPTDVYFWP